MKIVSKKHWFSYTMNFFMLIFICFPALYFYWEYKEKLVSPIWKYSIPITIALVFYQNLRAIILNLRVKWIFENEVLTIKSGLLPWRRNHIGLRKDQIFEVYYNKSFLGSVLNYGHLSVRRTDGTTTQLSDYKMTRPKKLANAVSVVLEKKQSDNQFPIEGSTAISPVEELHKLADLHTSGKISDDEFQRLKASILKKIDD